MLHREGGDKSKISIETWPQYVNGLDERSLSSRLLAASQWMRPIKNRKFKIQNQFTTRTEIKRKISNISNESSDGYRRRWANKKACSLENHHNKPFSSHRRDSVERSLWPIALARTIALISSLTCFRAFANAGALETSRQCVSLIWAKFVCIIFNKKPKYCRIFRYDLHSICDLYLSAWRACAFLTFIRRKRPPRSGYSQCLTLPTVPAAY